MVRIDEFTIDAPATADVVVINGVSYPPCTAFRGNYTDYSIMNSPQVNDFICSLIIPYAVTYRFPSTTNFDDLPLDQIGALYNNTSMRWIKQGRSIADDIQQTFLPVIDNPILCNRATNLDNDWLVVLLFEFGVSFIVDPENTALQPPGDWIPPIDDTEYSVEVGLWRRKKQSPDNLDVTLDFTL
ncbi:hypothetical protein BLD44_028365 [Mastigocladus laminosus UU774]|nr:hypothetical protein BLD44_028365 [Mastigocladus laminosus UU774]